MNAQNIRDSFSVLFGSRRIEDLKAELAEARKERDYFRGRADRLELMLLSPLVQKPIGPRAALDPRPIGRKPWIQVQAEELQKQEDAFKKEQEAKKAKGAN